MLRFVILFFFHENFAGISRYCILIFKRLPSNLGHQSEKQQSEKLVIFFYCLAEDHLCLWSLIWNLSEAWIVMISESMRHLDMVSMVSWKAFVVQADDEWTCLSETISTMVRLLMRSLDNLVAMKTSYCVFSFEKQTPSSHLASGRKADGACLTQNECVSVLRNRRRRSSSSLTNTDRYSGAR